MRRPIGPIALSLACLACPAVASADEPPRYPPARRLDLADVYHGVRVPDPYRWLEADPGADKEVATWAAAQDAMTTAYVTALPGRQAVRRRLETLTSYETVSAPVAAGGRYLYCRRGLLHARWAVWMRDIRGGEPAILMDEARWPADWFLAGLAVSPDGRYLAYATAQARSSAAHWWVAHLASATPLNDMVQGTWPEGISWSADSRGFYYGDVCEIRYHRLGTPATADACVYRLRNEPGVRVTATATGDGRYLVLTIAKPPCRKRRIAYLDLAAGSPALDLVPAFEDHYRFLGNDGPLFYFQTDRGAPCGRVIAIDVRRPGREDWREVVRPTGEPLLEAHLVGDRFVLTRFKDVGIRLELCGLAGGPARQVRLPGVGEAWIAPGARADREVFYVFHSITTPPTVYRLDPRTGEQSVFYRPRVAFDPDAYVVHEVSYRGRDGVRIPMTLAHRRGLRRAGTNPTLLHGYGGFAIVQGAGFRDSWLAWLELGGVLAIPGVRGGGEYGAAWHQAAQGARKQQTFDDFIAAAEWLVREGYTSPAKLAAEGTSNGGLLVGAVLTQRPDLFGACLADSGVFDMLRYDLLYGVGPAAKRDERPGLAWVEEYGSPADRRQFEILRAYSPYHNVRRGTRYPATLLTTGDADHVVAPAHSLKFAAALQHAQAGDAPVLLRLRRGADHGLREAQADEAINESANRLAFLLANLHVTPPERPPPPGPPAPASERTAVR